MECEMCGKKTGTRRYLVDRNVMNLGLCCARFGTAMDAPPAGSQAAVQSGLERRAARQTSRDVYQEEHEEFVEDFGKRIHDARERKGISKEDLGAKVHARVPELNKFEAGQLRPTLQQAKALERELGIKLLEKVQASVPAPKKGKGQGLTIGDLLRDALDK